MAFVYGSGQNFPKKGEKIVLDKMWSEVKRLGTDLD